MMSRDEIGTKVREIFQKTLRLEPEKLTDGATLKEDLNLDSLDLIEVVSEVEDVFDVQIAEESVKTIATFGQVVDGLHAALESKGAKGGA
ncbi:MAG: acyl carrier protein [Planctomycetes bacterium]|nr:acyl carrier protein [Planctomycetota bacterium]